MCLIIYIVVRVTFDFSCVGKKIYAHRFFSDQVGENGISKHTFGVIKSYDTGIAGNAKGIKREFPRAKITGRVLSVRVEKSRVKTRNNTVVPG